MKNEIIHYLAYGSNLDESRLKLRCPSAKFIRSGVLQGYKLVFDGYSLTQKSIVADIRKEKSAKIPYAIFSLNVSELNDLDRAEGYPKHYDRETISFPDLNVVCYFMTEYKKNLYRNEFKVSKQYEKYIRNGYIKYNLNQSYLDEALKDIRDRK